MKKVLILGGTGFIGHHMARRLKSEGCFVRVVDIQPFRWNVKQDDVCDEFVKLDLRKHDDCYEAFRGFIWDEVFQFGAYMGGAGFVFTGENDADIMHSSVQINLNVLSYHKQYKKIFYSSSACIYPQENQEDPDNPNCVEYSAYPANPDSDYGWEKIFSERLYKAYNRNYDVDIRIARFHNIFGPEGSWKGGREKAPAAMCRKVIESNDGIIEVWGKGDQTRSFLYIDECIDGISNLMKSNYKEPINIGSEEIISINNLALLTAKIANKEIVIENIIGPEGVRGRNSDNKLIQKVLNWQPNYPLVKGLRHTYNWIKKQVEK